VRRAARRRFRSNAPNSGLLERSSTTRRCSFARAGSSSCIVCGLSVRGHAIPALRQPERRAVPTTAASREVEYELCVRSSLPSATARRQDLRMGRPSHDDWFPALLTAGSFLAMILTAVCTCLDALEGSPWCALESTLGLACGASFMSLLGSGASSCRSDD
jgi:hypothetical protein